MDCTMALDDKVRDLIHEYLMKKGLLKTIDILLVNIYTGRMGKWSLCIRYD